MNEIFWGKTIIDLDKSKITGTLYARLLFLSSCLKYKYLWTFLHPEDQSHTYYCTRQRRPEDPSLRLSRTSTAFPTVRAIGELESYRTEPEKSKRAGEAQLNTDHKGTRANN